MNKFEKAKMEAIFKVPPRLCEFCGGTGMFSYERIKNITIYGMTTKEIFDLRNWATEHGYKND